jgi:hypothetical protein
MPSGSNLPTSLATLLATFQSVFTAPTFTTFCAMVSGFLAQTGEHNVCGMLSGAGLVQRWHHSRAHRFFSSSSWQINELGLRLATVIIDTLIERDAAIKQGGNPTFTSMFPSAFTLHCDVDTS